MYATICSHFVELQRCRRKEIWGIAKRGYEDYSSKALLLSSWNSFYFLTFFKLQSLFTY